MKGVCLSKFRILGGSAYPSVV